MTPSSEDLAARGDRVIFPTYARYPVTLVDGEGCRLRDAEGRTYLDFLSGLAVNALGYRHPAMVRALQEAAAGIWHTSNFFHSEPQVKLAERLTAATGMQRLFYVNSGAEAVETALKLARRLGGPKRTGFVAAERAFHGRTLGALTVTGTAKYRKPFEPLVPGVRHVPYGVAAALEAAVDDATAAVVLEAVQGEGGVHPAPPGYLERAFEICEERGALLVVDEVQTGVGRTGTFLAVERYGVLPHVVTLAKALGGGLPIGVCLARGRAAEGLGPGDHGSTFGGGPVICRVALAVLDEVLRPGFLESVRLVGSVLGRALSREIEGVAGVDELRGAGMMWGLQLREEKARAAVDGLRERGVLASIAGPSVLRLLPPLVLSPAEAEEGAAAVGAVLREVAG